MSFRSSKYLLLAAPFLLTACGEGYDMIRTDTMFPYGNQRTAGSGVAYVVAKMMPEKTLVLEPATPAPQMQVEETKQILKDMGPPEPEAQPEPEPMEKVFNEAQDK